MLSGPRSVTAELRSCPSPWRSVSLALAALARWLGTTTDLCHSAERLSRQSTPECWVIILVCSVAQTLMWDRHPFHRETTAKIHTIFMQLQFVFLLEKNELISLRASNLYYNTTSPTLTSDQGLYKPNPLQYKYWAMISLEGNKTRGPISYLNVVEI